MKVVVPAAGIGTRFLPASHAVPKELLPLGQKPLIHHALEEAEAAGFSSAILVLSPGKAVIRKYFERDPGLEASLLKRGLGDALRALREAGEIAERLDLRFVEQALPRGLGDAILRCRDIAGETFGVLLPDDVVVEDRPWRELMRLHGDTGAPCLCVRKVRPDQAHRFGIALCEPFDRWLQVKQLVEKPAPGSACSDLAVFGRYIVTTPVLDALEQLRRTTSDAELQLTTGFASVLDRPPGVFAVPFDGDFFDNGTPNEYARSLGRYAQQQSRSRPPHTSNANPLSTSEGPKAEVIARTAG